MNTTQANTTKTAAEITAESVLTKRQEKTFGPKVYTEDGTRYRITAHVRYDDRCGNGNNSFAITGTIDEQAKNGRWLDYSGGCIHDEIARHFPELAPLIKWHLCSSDGPMYYIENTVFHADAHGARKGWVYFMEPVSGKKLLVEYCSGNEWMNKYADKPDAYTFELDNSTVKNADYDAARNSAVWPEATDAELTQEPEALKAALLSRLPALLADFRAAVESLGFTW